MTTNEAIRVRCLDDNFDGILCHFCERLLGYWVMTAIGVVKNMTYFLYSQQVGITGRNKAKM
ncbi:hypothetical protein BZJ19_02105 [Salinivibrio proteolyticus]|nr:hypothetical protein BZJ19_02105 [Salinivibrio proteolyticus]